MQRPGLLLLLILGVALVPRLILMPMSGHFLDLKRHYEISEYMIDNGFLTMYDSPKNVNHPPIGVLLYAGSTWAFWQQLGGDLTAPYDPDNGWQVAAMKVPFLVFDLGLLALIFWIVRRYAGPGWAAFTTLAVAGSPPHLVNAAGWGQTDVLYTLALIMTVMLIKERRIRWAWIAYAVGWLSKFQCVMFFPIVFVFTWRRSGWRALLVNLAIFITIIVIGMVPFILSSGSDALAPFGSGSVNKSPYITNGSYNIWFWIAEGSEEYRTLDSVEFMAGVSYFEAALVLFSLVTALICVRVMLLPDRDDEFLTAAVAGLAFFMLPSQIQSRYMYIGLTFLALTLWQHPRLIPIFAGFVITFTQNIFDMMHLGSALIYYPAKLFFWDRTLTAVVNTVLFALVLVYFLAPLWAIRRDQLIRLTKRPEPGPGDV